MTVLFRFVIGYGTITTISQRDPLELASIWGIGSTLKYDSLNDMTRSGYYQTMVVRELQQGMGHFRDLRQRLLYWRKLISMHG